MKELKGEFKSKNDMSCRWISGWRKPVLREKSEIGIQKEKERILTSESDREGRVLARGPQSHLRESSA